MPPPKRSPKRASSSFPKPKPRPKPPGRAQARTLITPKAFSSRAPRFDEKSDSREPSKNGPRVVSNVVSIDKLAGSAVTIASAVEHAVFEEHRRADRAIAFALKSRRDLAAPDCRFIARAVFALFRWRGWIETLHLESMEHRLLLAWLMDQPAVHPACKVWARSINKDPERLYAYGGAPNWTARGEGWKRLNEGRIVSADPWRLFPNWLRDVLPLPPGGSSPKLKYLEFLQTLQTPSPLWVRAQNVDEQALWTELTSSGLKPWIHRKLTRAAKLDAEADIHHLPAFERGDLEIQDLASQAVALVCDPDPGERWWDVCAGAGGKALHLAALMKGKGLVVATDVHELRLKETARRAKRSPFRNLTTKPWDGKHVVGKAGTYHGVLVDAPCSAVGTWRRNPDARWTLDALAVARLAELQAQILKAASAGVRPGGTLVYSVCTLTLPETQDIIKAFLAENPKFQLDPFPHPILGTPTDGTLLIWPNESDTDAMFMARMIRTG
jgi:16S rRNA (cytosine967-C5)-methyltransferase